MGAMRIQVVLLHALRAYLLESVPFFMRGLLVCATVVKRRKHKQRNICNAANLLLGLTPFGKCLCVLWDELKLSHFRHGVLDTPRRITPWLASSNLQKFCSVRLHAS
jgi:hypothetical protein